MTSLFCALVSECLGIAGLVWVSLDVVIVEDVHRLVSSQWLIGLHVCVGSSVNWLLCFDVMKESLLLKVIH